MLKNQILQTNKKNRLKHLFSIEQKQMVFFLLKFHLFIYAICRVFFRAALHVNSNTGLDKPDVAAGGDNEGNIVEAQHMVFKKTFQYPLHKGKLIKKHKSFFFLVFC